jgi:hypothetical protein
MKRETGDFQSRCKDEPDQLGDAKAQAEADAGLEGSPGRHCHPRAKCLFECWQR